MSSSPPTLTLPGLDLAAAAATAEPVTWLKPCGADGAWPVPPGGAAFTIGSAGHCDLQLASRYVSRVHCLLDRRGARLRVHDLSSKNGVHAAARRHEQLDLQPGDVFVVGDVALLALSDRMHDARPRLGYFLGLDRHEAIDSALVLAAADRHLLLVGELTAGLAGVAALLHGLSPRRQRAFGAITALGDPLRRLRMVGDAHGTAFVDLDIVDLDAARLAAAVPGDRPSLRVMIGARDRDRAARALGGAACSLVGALVVPPLRERRSELRRLIDRILRDCGYAVTVDSLGAPALAALLAHDWPGNLDELEATVQRVAVVVTAPSDRRAAELLEVSPSSLQRWLERRGLASLRRW